MYLLYIKPLSHLSLVTEKRMKSMEISASEMRIEQEFVRGIREFGGIAFKFVSPGNNGVPDRIAILPGGKIWFVELKTARGRLSGMQQLQLDRIMLLGFQVRVAYGMAGVKELLREIRREVRDVYRSQ